MSITYCPHCDRPYDQDVDVEHEENCEAQLDEFISSLDN